jgi:hypothetical protein
VAAFVWLRWRLLINRWHRAGALNAVLMMVFTVGALIIAVPSLITTFILGLYLIPRAAPVHLMYAWDAVVVAFLFFWGIGLVIELQKTEPLSLSKFLHLPVSVNGAFLINYLSSLLRLSLVFFAPAMVGFSLALVFAKGIVLFPVLPLLAAFLLMVTALTYQFQGWLASLMSNPRRRRTVVVATTALFVLASQLPNFLNMYFMSWATQQRAIRAAALTRELAKLDRAFHSQEIDAKELVRRRQEVMETEQLAAQQAVSENVEYGKQMARIVNLALPVGWLPLGVMSAAESRVLPSILGVLGMTLIGTASLWRAYRTTIRQYRGESTSRKRRPAAGVASPASIRKGGTLLLETRIPGMSESVSAIALAGLRSLLRSPEGKMMLLMPLVMSAVFGSMLLSARTGVPESIRPLVGIAAMALVLLGLLQIMGNLFGFDRDGFRVFVLSSAPRRDILLGKNLAFAPLGLGMATILLALVQTVCPMRLDHFLSMFPQYISMFLLFCLLANALSIYTPTYIAAGALKPSNPKLSTVLLQLGMVILLVPLTQGPTLLPLGIESLLELFDWRVGAPICLVLTVVQCAIVVVLYRILLNWQGRLFQAREQSILESVANRAP